MAEKKKGTKGFETPEDLDEFMSEKPEGEEEGLEEEEAPSESFEGSESQEVTLPEEEEEASRPDDMLDIAADVPVQVVAVMGKRNITLKEMAALRMGEVIELNRPANEIVDLVAGGRLVAKGELVEIEGKLGVRIVKMIR